MFAFFSRFSGILVEGSLSTIISGTEIQSPSNSTPYLSSQDFILGANPSFNAIALKKIVATAYSSTPDQTDDTPFITASGQVVRDGIVASNYLAFGTKLRLPELFGDKIFVVEDRMHKRFSADRLDLWFPSRETAKNFGIKETVMEILE